MGYYTQFQFTAHLSEKPEHAALLDWLEAKKYQDDVPFDDHSFFQCPRWTAVFLGGGAVYQYWRPPVFERKARTPFVAYNSLQLTSTFKNYGSEIDEFLDWIRPFTAWWPGDPTFVGYSLGEEDERPKLHFIGPEGVRTEYGRA